MPRRIEPTLKDDLKLKVSGKVRMLSVLRWFARLEKVYHGQGMNFHHAVVTFENKKEREQDLFPVLENECNAIKIQAGVFSFFLDSCFRSSLNTFLRHS